MKFNKLIVALMISAVSSTAFCSNVRADEENLKTNENKQSQVSNLSDEEIDDLASFINDYNNYKADIPEDDEVLFEKNEKNIREVDGTNKFNRATETERDTFGEDKNVTNIDPEVKEKLEETDGEYGKKDGAYAGNNLRENTDPVKDIVVNNGDNENQIAITYFVRNDLSDQSCLVFDGIEYEPSRVYQTGDSKGYMSHTVVIDILAGNSYTYYIKAGSYTSDTYTLKTKALGENNEFSLAYFGDPQMGSGDSVWDSKGLNKNTQAKVDQDKIDFAKAIDRAMKMDPHFYLSMGDNVEIAGYEGEYDSFLDHDMFRERIFSTVTGNHETYMDKNDDNQQNTVFRDHFYLPNVSELGSFTKNNEDGTLTYVPGDYYYTYGDTLFINLNSNNTNSNEHREFIEKAIKEAERKRNGKYSWKVVSFHHAPYSTATHTSDLDIIERRKELVKIFNDNGIDIVLNGHDHIYTRSKHMLAGEKTLSFEDAYGVDPSNENAKIKDGYSETFNNKIYKNGKVIVDGIGLDYEGNKVINPRGTLFLTMAGSAGAKFYNPIGEDSWFVAKSLDDRSQLFSNLRFSKNSFSILTMDASGKVVDLYKIEKTNDFINNPHIEGEDVRKESLKNLIDNVENLTLVEDESNIRNYNEAVDKAKTVLNHKLVSQEEVDQAIEVLMTRLSEVEFADAKIVKETKDLDKKEVKNNQNHKNNKEDERKFNKESKNTLEKESRENVKTGVSSIMGYAISLLTAASALFISKKDN